MLGQGEGGGSGYCEERQVGLIGELHGDGRVRRRICLRVGLETKDDCQTVEWVETDEIDRY